MPGGALDAPGVGIDLLVEEIHALEQCLHLFRGIEQGQGERADDVPVLVAERDAVDEDLPFAALYAPPCAEFRLAGSDDRRDAGIGDEIRNVAAHGIFRADAQVIGVGVVDEPDDASLSQMNSPVGRLLMASSRRLRCEMSIQNPWHGVDGMRLTCYNRNKGRRKLLSRASVPGASRRR